MLISNLAEIARNIKPILWIFAIIVSIWAITLLITDGKFKKSDRKA